MYCNSITLDTVAFSMSCLFLGHKYAKANQAKKQPYLF